MFACLSCVLNTAQCASCMDYLNYNQFLKQCFRMRTIKASNATAKEDKERPSTDNDAGEYKVVVLVT